MDKNIKKHNILTDNAIYCESKLYQDVMDSDKEFLIDLFSQYIINDGLDKYQRDYVDYNFMLEILFEVYDVERVRIKGTDAFVINKYDKFHEDYCVVDIKGNNNHMYDALSFFDYTMLKNMF